MRVSALIAASILASCVSATAKDHVDDWISKEKDLLWRYCQQDGLPCAQVTEAAYNSGQHLTYPDIDNSTEFKDCYKDGGKCQIAKRSAEALASAVAEAYAEANPDPRRSRYRFCHLVGEPCLKKRDARRSRFRFCYLPGEPCLRRREPVSRVGRKRAEPSATDDSFCHGDGEQCAKLKSAVEEIASALVSRSAEPRRSRYRFCHLVGEPCLKRRDVDEADDADFDEDEYLEKRCFASGAPCDLAKRAAQDLTAAAESAIGQADL